MHSRQPVQRTDVRLQHQQLRQGRTGRAMQGRRRLHLGILFRRRLLQRRLSGRLRRLQSPRAARHLLADRFGLARSARRLHRQGRQHLRARRHLRRRRRLRELRPGHAVPGAVVHGQSAEHRRDLRRARHLSSPRRSRLSPVSLPRGRLHQHVQGRLRLRHRGRLREGDLRTQAARACLRGRQRVRLELLRRRRVLRERLRRRLSDLQLSHLARLLPDDRGWKRRSAERLQ
jgi:hypothetical protein